MMGRVAALVGDVVLVEQHHRQHTLEAAEVAEAEAAVADRAIDSALPAGWCYLIDRIDREPRPMNPASTVAVPRRAIASAGPTNPINTPTSR